MVYATPHSKLTIFGDSYGGQEEWQTGVRLTGQQQPSEADFGEINTAVQTFLGVTSVGFPNGFRYLGLKWAPQDVNGKYGENGEAIEWLRPTAFTGPGSAAGYPQIAMVLSLRTARSRGYASNGRMYWPSATLIDPATGRIPASNAGTVATAGAALIANINNAGIGTVAVMSAVGSGRTEVVTSVRVGRVMDTQRRRRNGLVEEYTTETPLPS